MAEKMLGIKGMNVKLEPLDVYLQTFLDTFSKREFAY